MPYNTSGFGKSERLCSKKLIEELFKKEDAHRIHEHPFLLLWKIAQLPGESPAQVVIGVSKKQFSKAVDRNRIKRQIKELYRQNKIHLYELLVDKKLQLAIGIIYRDSTKHEMSILKNSYENLIKKLIKNIEQIN